MALNGIQIFKLTPKKKTVRNVDALHVWLSL